MTKFLRFVLAISFATTLHFTAASQSVSINTSGAVADPSAMLDVTSTTKGMLIPRMDKTQKNAIATPATGLLIYQTSPDSLGFQYYDGAQWIWLSGTSDSTAWKITGNSNITSARFLGTTNDSAVRFRVRNYPSGIIDSTSGNTALGYRGSFENNTTGKFNVAMGFNGLRGNTTGSDNIGIGVNAGFTNDTASRNVSIGRDALYLNKHPDNTAVGYNAGVYVDLNPTGFPTKEVTYLGTDAGFGFWTGSKTVGLGFRALYNYEPSINTVWGSSLGRNVAIGDSAMALTYSSRNVAIGVEALSRARISSQNVAIGDSAMGGALTTVGNVAVGYKALSKQQNQGYNTAVGYFSQRDSSVNTYYNTSIGAFSMEFNRTGVYNTGLGLSALRSSDSSNYNTAVGSDAMYNHRGFNGSNAAFGSFALRGDSIGFWNTAIGSEAMDRIGFDGTAKGTGFSNVAVGFRALRQVRQGIENTAVGTGALEFDSSGNYNTAIGRYAGFFNKKGDFNASLGMQAGRVNDTASYTTFIGGYAPGYYNRNHYNTGIGSYSLTYNNFTTGASTTGAENTGLGYGAGYLINQGSKNVAVGYQSMNGNGFYIYGNRNVAVGDSSLFSNYGGSDNVAIGMHALAANTYAFANVAVGGNAMRNNTTSLRNTVVGDSAMYTFSYDPGGAYFSDNTAIGSKALFYTQPISAATGTKNTVVGSEAMYFNTTGAGNTAIGVSALRENTTGSSNTVVGRSANRLSNSGSKNSYYGFEVAYSDSSGTDNVAIGFQAAFSNDSASYITAIGSGALSLNKHDNNFAIGYLAGAYTDFSPVSFPQTRATHVGTESGYGYWVGPKSVSLGYRSLYNYDPGTNNIFGTSLGRNVAIGDSAMAFTYAGGNTVIGTEALSRARSAGRNVVIGDSAMGNAYQVYDNVAVGYRSLVKATRPSILATGNTGTGAYSLRELTSAIWNTANGYFALENDSTGSENTAMGTSALRGNYNGIRNVGIGINSGYNVTSSNNSYLGSYAGEGVSGRSTGGENTGIGYQALQDIRSGANNTAVGYRAMNTDSTGSLNTAVGNGALFSNTQSNVNQAFGYNALFSYNGGALDGYNNAFGDRSLENLQTGQSNVSMGSWAMLAHSTGNFNTAMGNYVMGGGTGTGSSNTAIGNTALFSTASDGNTAVGASAGSTITTGNNNTFLGYFANATAGNLSNATAIGYNATVAASNSLVLGQTGTNVGINETSPNARLHIVRSGASGGSYHASSSAIIEDNTNSYLQFSNPNANETGFLSGNASTTIRSGIIFRADSSIQFRSGGNNTRMVIDNNGFVGIGNTAPGDLLHVGTTTGATIRIGSLESIEDFGANILAINASWYPTTDNTRSLGITANRWTAVYAANGTIQTSDARDKENITNLNYGLKEIMKLRPVTYTWKDNPQWGKKIGFIAQEVQPVLGEVVQVGDLKAKTPSKDADTNPTAKPASDKLGIYYSDIIPVTVKAIQEQQQTIQTQQKQIEDLKKKNEQLEKDMQAIKTKLGINN